MRALSLALTLGAALASAALTGAAQAQAPQAPAQPPATATANPPGEPPATAAEVAALRSEVAALREELKRSQAGSPSPPSPPESPPANSAGDKAPSKPATLKVTAKDGAGGKQSLPLQFTAFGDFFYRFAKPQADAFAIGAVELDVTLKLTPYVEVSTALAYSGADNTFDLAAFVVDCGLAGDGDHYLLKSKLIKASGLSFGRFDVPFGIAYLEYPSVNNRLITTPIAVLGTHDSWNDLGIQAYALGKHWTTLAYLVNGPGISTPEGGELPARSAVGGRVSGKLDGVFEVGGSLAGDFASGGGPLVYAGGDATAALGPLELRGEYLLKHLKVVGARDDTTGVYGRAVLDLKPAYLVGRFDSLFSGTDVVDRRITAGGAFEVFPRGELRAVYDQSLDLDERSVTLQLVGGSTFQPTGFRR